MCPADCREEKIVSETIKCVFKDSDEEQKCYTIDLTGEAYCSGVEACNVEVAGEYGKTLTWKSNCGEYAYTTLDGRGEYAEFDCTASTSSGSTSAGQ